MKKSFILATVLVLALVVIPLVYSLLTDEIVVYFNLDDVAGPVIDSVSAANGVANGVARGVPGVVSTAFNFTGVSATNVSLGSPAASNDFTYSIWLNHTNAGANGFALRFGDNNKMIMVSATTISAYVQTDAGDINVPGVSYSFNKWTHVVITYDGTNFKSYINGTLNHTATGGNPVVGNSQLWLGVGTDGGDRYAGAIDEVGYWSRALSAAEVTQLYNNGAGFTYPFANLAPVEVNITLLSPGNVSTNSSSQMNFSASHITNPNSNNTNGTIWLYFQNGTLFNRSSFSLVGGMGVTNTSAISIYNMPPQNYYWNIFGCAINQSSHTNCKFANGNFSLTIGALNISSTYNRTVYETGPEGFYTEVRIPSAGSISGTTFTFNGTERTATSSNSSTTNYTFNSAFEIPYRTGSVVSSPQNIFWNISYSNGFSQLVSSDQISYNIINLTICGSAPNNVPYVNFTFKNETASQESVTASIPSSTWVYTLGSGTLNKTLSYSTASELFSQAFCFSPAHRKVSIDVDLAYDNSYSEQRAYSPNAFTQTNSTLNQILFLLPTSEGIFVTFQVLNSADQPLSGVLIVIEDQSGNVISSTTTGASGTTTVFLNPDSTYTLTASKAGFETFTATQTFSTAEYTITLGGGTTIDADDLTIGVTRNVQPPSGFLFNNTDYEFNLTLSSTFWSLDDFGFYLQNDTGAIIAHKTLANSTGGFISVTNNTMNYKSISMNYYWRINGNYSNSTVGWLIGPQKEGSIKGFFQRFLIYMQNGLLGSSNQNDFNLGLIIFIVIFITVGVVTFKFGIVHEVIFSGLVLGLVGFFDSGLDLLPGPRHVYTGIMLLIFGFFLVREATR